MKEKHSPLSQLRYDIVEVAKKIQKRFGKTHSEINYHKLMFQNLKAANFTVEYKPKLIVAGDLGEKAFSYEPDLRVSRGGISILVELKADDSGILNSHVKQAQSYLSVSPKDRAVLLINFARNDKKNPFLPEFRMVYPNR